MPAALSYTYCDQTDAEAVLSVLGVAARLDDDDSGTVEDNEQAYMPTLISWTTARVNDYLLGKHPASELAGSWIVNRWAAILLAELLCQRRGNPVPGSLKELVTDTLDRMGKVQDGKTVLADAAQRDAAFFSFVNARVDIGYRLRKVRVERPISDRSPTTGRVQNRDRMAEIIIEPN